MQKKRQEACLYITNFLYLHSFNKVIRLVSNLISNLKNSFYYYEY